MTKVTEAEDGKSMDGSSPVKRRKGYKGVSMEGAIARWYSKNQEKSIEQYKAWAKLVNEHLPEGGAVLEVAPGPGYLAIELAKLGTYRVVGIDISKTFVRIATEKAAAARVSVAFRHGDAAYMPFPRGTFDFAICTAAFKNFPEPVKVLDEIYRVLRSGGVAVIIDLRRDASKGEIDEAVDQMKLNAFDSFVTKVAFRSLLLRWAHTSTQMQEYAAESCFGTCDIRASGIGFEAWLRKP